jgi:hypothetical protein
MPHNPNGFSGFPVAKCITQLKQGVNEIDTTARRRPEHYW